MHYYRCVARVAYLSHVSIARVAYLLHVLLIYRTCVYCTRGVFVARVAYVSHVSIARVAYLSHVSIARVAGGAPWPRVPVTLPSTCTASGKICETGWLPPWQLLGLLSARLLAQVLR